VTGSPKVVVVMPANKTAETLRMTCAEYHKGYCAHRRGVLEAVNFAMNSDDFIFDQEIVAQFEELGARIAEVPVPPRYFP